MKLIKNNFIPLAFILSAFVSVVMARDCNDTLYSRLVKTPIATMTSDEYQYYRIHEGRCDKYKNWIDSQIVWIGDKLISEMDEKEADYFADRATDLSWCKPCSLKQYLAIKDNKKENMTKYEKIFYETCRDKCEEYIKENPTTKSGKFRKGLRKSRIFIIVALSITVGLIGGIIFYSIHPSGPK